MSIGIDAIEFRIAMGHPIVDLPSKHQVFIREVDPEWPIWNAYLRKTTGKRRADKQAFRLVFSEPAATNQPDAEVGFAMKLRGAKLNASRHLTVTTSA